jgi:putative hydrolase of the HAD superfamily
MSVLDGATAVFFDAVGTLLLPHPDVAKTYAAVAHRHGVEVDEDAIGPRFREAFRAEEAADRADGWVTSEAREVERWRRVVAAALPGTGEAAFVELFTHFARPSAWRLPFGAGPVFTEMAARGLVLGIASNFDRRLAAVLAGFPDLAPLAGRVVISSQVGVRKPHPRFFAELAAVAGYDPGRIVLVGDDVGNDMVGATEAGLRAVLYDPANRYPKLRPRVATFAELLT